MAIFSKVLTKTDIRNRLSFPTKCLKSLPPFGRGHAIDFCVRDESGHVWTFRCSLRKKKYLKPVLSKGWLAFVRNKNLKVGDKIMLYKEEDLDTRAQFKIEVQKAIKVFGDIFGYAPIHSPIYLSLSN